MKINCLSNKKNSSTGKLQTLIFNAIELLIQDGYLNISANMVKDKCNSLYSGILWPKRIPAICNSMRHATDCGAHIVSENRDFGNFTIEFRGKENMHFPNKISISHKNVKSNVRDNILNQSKFIDDLVDVLHVFSPEGRNRIYSDLTKVNTQLLCLGILNGQVVKGVRLYGKYNRNLIEKRIIEKNTSSTFIDNEINWENTSGKRFDLIETQKAVIVIINYISILKKKGNLNEFANLFIKELKGNNTSLIRLLSQPKYISRNPGRRLVGKQTEKSKTNKLGYVLEHTIPVEFLKIKLLQIIDSNSVEIELEKVMSKLFAVWLNTDDDIKLKDFGLNSKMPINWTWEDDPLERYWSAGISKDSLVTLNCQPK